jgi:hypothetical protein
MVQEDFGPTAGVTSSKPQEQPEQPKSGIIIIPQIREIPFTVHHCGAIFNLSVRKSFQFFRKMEEWNLKNLKIYFGN